MVLRNQREEVTTIHSMTNTEHRTAAEAYAARFTECKDLLERIGKQLDVHRNRPQGSLQNWGFPGDLSCAIEQLAYVLATLSDRSAVDEHGLSYQRRNHMTKDELIAWAKANGWREDRYGHLQRTTCMPEGCPREVKT
jgi:hypothetical protein